MKKRNVSTGSQLFFKIFNRKIGEKKNFSGYLNNQVGIFHTVKKTVIRYFNDLEYQYKINNNFYCIVAMLTMLVIIYYFFEYELQQVETIRIAKELDLSNQELIRSLQIEKERLAALELAKVQELNDSSDLLFFIGFGVFLFVCIVITNVYKRNNKLVTMKLK